MKKAAIEIESIGKLLIILVFLLVATFLVFFFKERIIEVWDSIQSALRFR